MPRHLITGASGFVGRHLTRALLSRGDSCRLLVRPSSDVAELAGRGDVEVRRGDVCDPESLRGVAQGIQHVYHLAAAGHVTAQSR